ncbi:hypothetical protein KQ51_00075 [Candidatus Izimaplasma bacterium HR1]|jgi:hypothetical protein|uniref:DUF6320 domain-containing protein n=1 Tax=Candidatus Izimoplasma sp. HR1 TaxID=1541959 RepID=UPI0004F87A15|nr:hypothetical protein KQ51_00075 [Candidatus Izimaplasma bacterium HR1]
MKECNKCKITIATHYTYCPLCHQTLTGEVDPKFEELYAVKEHVDHIPKKTYNIFLFIGAISIIVLGVVNLATMKYGFWSLIPIGAIIYIFFLLRYSILSRINAMKRVTVTGITLFLLLLFINIFTDRQTLWSVDIILPSLIMTNNFAVSLIMLIRNRDFKEYALSLLLLVLFSSVPLIAYYTGLSGNVILPIFTIAQGISILIFMVVFYPKILKEVLQKTFHI